MHDSLQQQNAPILEVGVALGQRRHQARREI
jgi:hypothetical protein